MKIVFLGPPASGKGTQAEMLSKLLKLPNISVGQLLREEVQKKSEIGQEVEDILKKGELVSNALVNKIVEKRLAEDDLKNGFIFDGFPRTRIQAKFLNQMIQIDKVLLINVADNEIIRRLSGRRVCEKCGETYHIEFNPPQTESVCDRCGGKLISRSDDTPEAIHQRLKIYHTETQPVVEYYQEKDEDKLIEINGEQTINKVFEEIKNKLNLA